MKRNIDSHSSHSLRVFFYFCALVGSLILLSLGIKIFTIAVKSNYDDKHRFTVVFIDTPSYVYSVSPETKTISILEIPVPEKKSSQELTKNLHIPIDATVTDKKQWKSSDPKKNSDERLNHMVFSFPKIATNLTIVDAVRLWMFSQSIDTHNVFYEKLSSSIEEIDAAVIDKTVSELFLDTTISKENESIQIINATGTAGVGNTLAQIFTNIGGNVVSVKTAHNEEKKTTITYNGEYSYTVKKFEKILGVKASKMQKNDIFAIIVSIGKDRISYLQE